jgi:DNA polymerase I
MNRLLLIDGNAVLHRAYHALPPMRDPDGNIVNAVYGFASMMLKLFGDFKPTYMAVAFDRPAPTFRKKIYKDYQATRPKLDTDLVSQIEKVHDVVRAMQLPIYELDGFEADDLIGTLATRVFVDMKDRVDQVIIVTGDRDILQLVEEGKVYVSMPTKGLSEAKLYGEKETVERMGVKPTQIADLKALMGDQSDNYPGVEGIGPKTAVTILQNFGSVERLYVEITKGNTGAMADKLREKLLAAKETALLMHDLATIRRDVPIDIALHTVETLNTPDARNALQAFGFNTLYKRLTGELFGPAAKPKKEPEKKKAVPDPNEQQQLF